MNQLSSSSITIRNTLDVPPDVRIDNGVYDSIEVVDDSMYSLMKGIPLDIFRWSEGAPIEIRPFLIYTAASTSNRRSCFFSRGTSPCYRSPDLFECQNMLSRLSS